MASSPPKNRNNQANDDGLSDEDDQHIAAIISMNNGQLDLRLDGPIDQAEKADDAIDYEDLSDDDLPDEEPGNTGSGDAPGLTDDGGTPNDTDDLFGEDEAFDIFDKSEVAIQNGPESGSFDTALTLPSPPEFRDVNFDPPEEEVSGDDKIKNAKDICPQFELGAIPYINEWFPTRKAYYNPRPIAKPPKPLSHPKISLDIAPDQERAFRSAGPNVVTSREQRIQEAAARGIILDLPEEEEEEEVDVRDFTRPAENKVVNPATGLTIGRLRFALQDSYPRPAPPEAEDAADAAWLEELGERPRKKQKVDHLVTIDRTEHPVPSFDNYQELTAQIGSRIVLDANDEALLIVPVDQKPQNKRSANGNLKSPVIRRCMSRFNISNDDSTDALKANNQSKIRATIGAVEIEHSMPALKCSFPYYKVKLGLYESRAFHRMPLQFNKFQNNPIYFKKSGIRKRKHMKGMTTKQIYAKTSDLSLNDNSHAMLLEYSEEIPTVLSNFGMGNKVLNYYRKTNDQDNFRPKLDVGEPRILQPTDESPFSRFGTVDPGQTVPTLHNSMYRAPIFKHEPKQNDFLVVRNTTWADGTNFYLRNIDHVYVVGQELPSVEVPGPHSRKVTTATRNRMTMVSFRLIRHSKEKHVKVGDITNHILDSTDMQNRQKLKEILKYDKDKKVWKLKDDQTPLDEETVRAMITPEDVCLIDSMQVGVRQLEDAGYAQTDEAYDAENDKATDTLDQQLAPWRTTKAFLEASAGKAMLELKGNGDPSGCGIAVSMIKTSMKGGFLKGLQSGGNSTSADAMERMRKANGGHDYNVHEQEAKYAEVLGEIWKTQRELLSDPVENTEMDEQNMHEEEQRHAQTPGYTAAATPAPGFDDSASMISDAQNRRVLRITRRIRNPDGTYYNDTQVVSDPRIAREYTKRRAQRDADKINIYDTTTTGDPEADKAKAARAKQELDRLERNKERRIHRENAKKRQNEGGGNATPGPSTPAPSDVGGVNGSQVNGKEKSAKKKTVPGTTARRCANCQMAGHIKTNRKLCPQLNGEWPNGIQPEGWVPAAQRASIATPSAVPDTNGGTPINSGTPAAADEGEDPWSAPQYDGANQFDGANDFQPLPQNGEIDDFAMDLGMDDMGSGGDVNMGGMDDEEVDFETVI